MFKACVLAVVLTFPAAVPVMAQTAPAATAAPDDFASIAMAEQVITNLGMLDVMIYGYDQGVRESSDFADLTDAQKDRYIALFNQRIDEQRLALTHTLAVNAAAHLTRDEMTRMLALSKIGYLKAVIKASAEGSPDPDPAMMSPDEKATYDKYENADFVGRFLDGVDINLISDDVVQIGADAYTAWQTEAGTTPAQ